MNDTSPSGPDLSTFDSYLTRRDLERSLRVSERTIRRWAQAGILPPPVKLGGVNRWRADEVRRMLRGTSAVGADCRGGDHSQG